MCVCVCCTFFPKSVYLVTLCSFYCLCFWEIHLSPVVLYVGQLKNRLLRSDTHTWTHTLTHTFPSREGLRFLSMWRPHVRRWKCFTQCCFSSTDRTQTETHTVSVLWINRWVCVRPGLFLCLFVCLCCALGAQWQLYIKTAASWETSDEMLHHVLCLCIYEQYIHVCVGSWTSKRQVSFFF